MNLNFNKQKLEEKIKEMTVGGAKKLHILADFDKTFTTGATINGIKVSSVIGQLRTGGYLTPNYKDEAFALFEKYGPTENNLAIPRAQRSAKMEEWWTKHHELLIKCRLNKNDMDTVIKAGHMQFRGGTDIFFKLLKKYEVPVVIMSGAPAYMIQKQFELAGILFDNIHIVANWYEYDQNGYMTGFKKPIIHSLNKYEVILREFPFFNQIKERTNVILLGDQVDDLGMIEGFDYEQLLTIAFANKPEDETKLANKFDLTIGDSGNFNFINEIVNKIL